MIRRTYKKPKRRFPKEKRNYVDRILIGLAKGEYFTFNEFEITRFLVKWRCEELEPMYGRKWVVKYDSGAKTSKVTRVQ